MCMAKACLGRTHAFHDSGIFPDYNFGRGIANSGT